MAERRYGGRRGDARGNGRGGGRGDLPNEEVARQRDLRDIENDDLRQQVRDLERDIENGALRQQVRDLQRRLARLEKLRGKSNPMSSSAPERRSMDDPLFSDVFTSSEADEPSKNSDSNIFSMPVYDTPAYDEDIFYALPEPPKDSNNNILSILVYDTPVYDENKLLMPVYDEPIYDNDILSMPVYDEDILSMAVYDEPIYDDDDLTDSVVATSSSRNNFLDKEKLGSKVAGLDWNFSGYGGIDEGCNDDWSFDLLIAHKVSDIENVPRFSHSMILEGGSIQFDGEGMCLTTEECLKYKEIVEGNGGGFGSGTRGRPKGSKNRKILQVSHNKKRKKRRRMKNWAKWDGIMIDAAGEILNGLRCYFNKADSRTDSRTSLF